MSVGQDTARHIDDLLAEEERIDHSYRLNHLDIGYKLGNWLLHLYKKVSHIVSLSIVFLEDIDYNLED